MSSITIENRKAHHDYYIEETFEAGIVLEGSEVKSVRKGSVNLKDGFVRIINGEAFLWNVHISPYAQANTFKKYDPERTRKLLLHRKEIDRLFGFLKKNQGYTLVPLKMYAKGGYFKVLIGLAKGKKNYDKREDAAKKDAQREMERAFKGRN